MIEKIGSTFIDFPDFYSFFNIIISGLGLKKLPGCHVFLFIKVIMSYLADCHSNFLSAQVVSDGTACGGHDDTV